MLNRKRYGLSNLRNLSNSVKTRLITSCYQQTAIVLLIFRIATHLHSWCMKNNSVKLIVASLGEDAQEARPFRCYCDLWCKFAFDVSHRAQTIWLLCKNI